MRVLGWVGALVVAVGAVGLGVNLCLYRGPATDVLQGKLSFFYQHADDPGTPGIELSEGTLAFDLRRQLDSSLRGFTLGAKGEARLYNVGFVRGRIEGTGTLRQYLQAPIPLYTYGGLDAALDTAYLQPWVEAQAGLGYGRFYNVSPLARVAELEDVLLHQAVITASLPLELQLELAEIVGRREEVQPLAGRVAAVVARLEAYLAAQGRPSGLDPATVLLVEQLLREPRPERYCGWTVQGGFAYRLLDPQGRPGDLLFSLALDAAVAPSEDSQLLLRAKVTGPYGFSEQYTLNLDVSFDVRVERRVTFSAQYTLFLDKPRGQSPAGTQKAQFQLEIAGGWIGLSLKMEFSKAAEAPTWRQAIVISTTAYLW
ncbi:MAG: hypothetical protein N2320_05185 [Candidatus Bipolaricaulota bacterium]|nr:hypothetical protein [Candidatus Bipolaricaulota bacterium]